MPVPDYLKNNIGRINSLPPQNLPAWNSNYDNKVFNIFPVMGNLRRKFPNKIISRADIVNLFRSGNSYLGFVAAMVWGYINASRPRVSGGDRTTTNLYRALSHPEQKVLNAIKNAEHYFTMGDFRTPFKYMMQNGRYRIPGIGYAYFTKIFFFAGQANTEIKIKPLIFDKWTSNAFFALLSQTHPNEISKFFRAVKDGKKAGSPGVISLRSGKKLSNAYVRFVELMNYWASSIGVSPAKLEEFLFGYSLKSGISQTLYEKSRQIMSSANKSVEQTA